jgi:dCMP deaminase
MAPRPILEPAVSKANKYHRLHMDWAARAAVMSHSGKKQVGCMIMSPLGNPIASGWNGMPSGYPNQCEYEAPVHDRDWDAATATHTHPEVLHAEENAIGKCAAIGQSTRGAILYVTHVPCVRCARLIWRAGIAAVYYLHPYDGANGATKDGSELLRRTGVALVRLSLLGEPVLTEGQRDFNLQLESETA